MSPLPKIKAISANGEEIHLDTISELQIEWPEGLPATLLFSPPHLSGASMTLEVGSAEDQDDQLTEYGVIALRPGASNILDITIETEHIDPTAEQHDHSVD